MSVVLTLSSCANEDFYSLSENNSKQEIISKSLWKEDTLFTKRIYDHFQKSFMSTEADQQKFVSEHGTPVWEYAMTMGFKRNQLFVPLIQNNTVIGVMRVQRQNKKAFYALTQDSEALKFFDIVMYNRNHDKLQPQKDEKLSENIYSKGATWSCSKRSVITGYHMEGDVMVMESSLINVCKYSYTGGKPYVDHLEVDTDGMEGGGGDDGEENEEEYEGSPCDKITTIGKNSKTKALFKNLKGKTNLNAEHGYILNQTGYTNTINETAIEGPAGKAGINYNVSKAIDGVIHSHYQGLLPVFSAADMFAFAQLYKNGFVKDPETFVMGVVTASGTQYMMVIDDPSKFAVFADNLYSGNTFDQSAIDTYELIYSWYKISAENTTENNEMGFYNYLEANKTGLKVLKGDNEFSNWKLIKEDANGNIISEDCP